MEPLCAGSPNDAGGRPPPAERRLLYIGFNRGYAGSVNWANTTRRLPGLTPGSRWWGLWHAGGAGWKVAVIWEHACKGLACCFRVEGWRALRFNVW